MCIGYIMFYKDNIFSKMRLILRLNMLNIEFKIKVKINMYFMINFIIVKLIDK